MESYVPRAWFIVVAGSSMSWSSFIFAAKPGDIYHYEFRGVESDDTPNEGNCFEERGVSSSKYLLQQCHQYRILHQPRPPPPPRLDYPGDEVISH